MPQEAWVLKCYSCKKFQVQLTKKAKKWKCTVCGAKQDLMTIFFKGHPSDCRVNVQNLNLAEGEAQEKLQNQYDHKDEICDSYVTNKYLLEQDEMYEFEEALEEIKQAQEDEAELFLECQQADETYSRLEEMEDHIVNTIEQEAKDREDLEDRIIDTIQQEEYDSIFESVEDRIMDTIAQEEYDSIFEIDF